MINTHLVLSEAESGLLTIRSQNTRGLTDGVTWQQPNDNRHI